MTARDSARTPPPPANDRAGAERPGTRDPGARDPGARDPGARDPGARASGTKASGAKDTGAKASDAKGPGAKGSVAKGPGAERPAYEQARDELTELVKRLEAGGLTLEQSLALWERGERLAVICEEWLEGARARLAAAMGARGGESDAGAAPF